MNLKINKYLNYLIDLLYPKLCVTCATPLVASENHFCLNCLISLPKTNSHITETVKIDRKFWGKIQVKNTYAFLEFTKKGKVQKILHQLKYKNKPELAEYLGKLYANDLKSIKLQENIDLIVGIPLHEAKKKQRGYNQADCFAIGLAENLGVEVNTDLLIRTKNTKSQTQTSGRLGRFENIEGVFKLLDNSKIKNKRIAMVDDVLTTGATLEQAGQLLIEAGCKDLYIITIASAI